jgi:hypothetical protein
LTNKISKCEICSAFFGSKKELRDHKDNIHRIADHLTTLTSGAAGRLVDRILYSMKDGGILGVAVIDKKGNILSAKSVESFKETFGIARDGEDYGGTLAIATLSVVNQIKDSFGEPQSIITVHKNCKLILLNLPLYDLLVGLVLERWADADDDRIASNIERLIADTVDNEINLDTV